MSKYADVARTVYARTRRRLSERSGGVAPRDDQSLRDCLAGLLRKGYAVIHGYFDAQTCQQLRNEADRIFREYDSLIWRDERRSDNRAFAADAVSTDIAKFRDDPFINSVAKAYLSSEQRVFFTLCNKVLSVPDNLGSGGGWHRDTPHERQFKSILYLSDVAIENGAFEYIDGSHRLRYFLSTIIRAGIVHGQNRFTNEEVDEIVKATRTRPTTLTGSAGTLIVVDSSGIHRGSPIVAGERYALTNYFFSAAQIEAHKSKGKFTNYFVNRTG